MAWFGGAIALLLVLMFGCYWCYVVLARLKADVTELRESKEPATKTSIVVVWIITGIIAIVLLGVGSMLAVVARSELRSWF